MPKTLVYFVSDLHGSSMCFRKFVNSTKVYKPKVLILGGDVAGKAIQSIVKAPNNRYQCEFVGTRYDISDDAELKELERLIADHGYYPYRAEPGELEAMEAAGTLDELFLKLMRERLTEWLEIADTRRKQQRRYDDCHPRHPRQPTQGGLQVRAKKRFFRQGSQYRRQDYQRPLTTARLEQFLQDRMLLGFRKLKKQPDRLDQRAGRINDRDRQQNRQYAPGDG